MATITPEEAVRLGRLTTRDSAGRHFTERCSTEELQRWESLGLVKIHRPAHPATGLPYSEEHWSLEVSEEVADWFDDDGELDHDALDAYAG